MAIEIVAKRINGYSLSRCQTLDDSSEHLGDEVLPPEKKEGGDLVCRMFLTDFKSLGNNLYCRLRNPASRSSLPPVHAFLYQVSKATKCISLSSYLGHCLDIKIEM